MTEQVNDSGVSLPKHDTSDSVAHQSAPVVFQCAQCNSIVGDSTSWISSNKHLRSITLGYVTSKVVVTTELKTCQDGADKGSTYYTLVCGCCRESLGKQYVASCPSFDVERRGFTFLVEKLNSYEIRSAEVAMTTDLTDFITVSSPQEMHERIAKVRVMIMALNNRVSAIESHMTAQIMGETQNMSASAVSQEVLSDQRSDTGESVMSGDTGQAGLDRASTTANISPVSWKNDGVRHGAVEPSQAVPAEHRAGNRQLLRRQVDVTQRENVYEPKRSQRSLNSSRSLEDGVNFSSPGRQVLCETGNGRNNAPSQQSMGLSGGGDNRILRPEANRAAGQGEWAGRGMPRQLYRSQVKEREMAQHQPSQLNESPSPTGRQRKRPRMNAMEDRRH